jgi:ankyrin repeat protein
MRNVKGERPLHKACAGLLSGTEEAIQTLLNMPGINCNARTTDEKTPLDYAVTSGAVDMERLLSLFKGNRRRAR